MYGIDLLVTGYRSSLLIIIGNNRLIFLTITHFLIKRSRQPY